MSSWIGELLTEWQQRYKSVQAEDSSNPTDAGLSSGALELLRKHIALAGPRVVEVLRELQRARPDHESESDTRDVTPPRSGAPVFGRRVHASRLNDVPAEAKPLRRMRLPRGVLLSRAAPCSDGQAGEEGCAVTAGMLVARGFGATVYCRCAHGKALDAAFFERFQPDMRLRTIQGLLKCSGCGEKGAIQTVVIAPERLTGSPALTREPARTLEPACLRDDEAVSLYPPVSVN